MGIAQPPNKCMVFRLQITRFAWRDVHSWPLCCVGEILGLAIIIWTFEADGG